ncbi:MAG TPA: XdhC family protein, partial [Aquabacterium sp.]|nr:XdhC family protein [Aquabacterium sp.]
LRREDVRSGQAWVGMIGSRTKRAAFEHRLQARGHAAQAIARLRCPIGLPGIQGKEPAIIAIAVIAQLLQDGQA